MKLGIRDITAAAERYHRERDRYEKLTRIIEELCVAELCDRRGFAVNITARTKRVNSFEGKLRRIRERKTKKWKDVEDVFKTSSGLSDFSGVRIVYYSPTDKEAVIAALKRIFVCGKADNKDRAKEKKGSFYQAVHIQAAIPEELISPDTENLRGLKAELQICSVMSHVWNEVEHDIDYKPSGSTTKTEKDLLAELGRIKIEGDKIIASLMSAHHERMLKEDRIEDEASLEKAILDHFYLRRNRFSGNCTRLLENLEQLNIHTRKEFKAAMGVGKPGMGKPSLNAIWKKAQNDIRSFNSFLPEDKKDLKLEPTESTDPAFFLILQHSYKKILRDFPAGRSRGRPRKIRSWAYQYKEYSNAAK